MKVSDLIEALRKMPPDAAVLHLWDGEARTEVQHVWLSKRGDVITADYDMVCYSTDTRPVDAPNREQDRYWQTPSDPAGEDEDA